jgi:hypothetical protein
MFDTKKSFWLVAMTVAAALGCDQAGDGLTASPDAGATTIATQGALHAMMGPAGGELVGARGTPFEGVKLTVPAGALAEATDVAITVADGATPLPKTAVRCGPMFALAPAGLKLAVPATVTLPYDPAIVGDQNRFEDEVKVWVAREGGWGQRLQTDNAASTVSVEIESFALIAAGVNPPADEDEVHFTFKPNPKFLGCLAQYPDDPEQQPSVDVTVVRGDLNDGLFLRGRNIKPGLKFDMFTVERSSLLADGTVDPTFDNFGLAWYQSDLEANDKGKMKATIRTILLDQIFGFDPKVALPPTGTFQVGFWFNDPADAAACGFDVSKPTPFNGDHKAGPLAMITTPDATTGLGPLCTKPDTSTTPAHCSP